MLWEAGIQVEEGGFSPFSLPRFLDLAEAQLPFPPPPPSTSSTFKNHLESGKGSAMARHGFELAWRGWLCQLLRKREKCCLCMI